MPGSKYFPQANGLAEAAVKNAEHLLDKCKGDWAKFDDAFAECRDVPNACGYTLAEIFLAHRTRGSLPILPGKTRLNVPAAEQGAEIRKQLREKEYNKWSTRDLCAFSVGQKVHVHEYLGRKRWLPVEATITAINQDGRSYQITMNNGFETSRNRRHLRSAQEEMGPLFDKGTCMCQMGPIYAEWDQYLPNGTSICRTGPVFDKGTCSCHMGPIYADWDQYLPNGTGISAKIRT